jgi:glycine/D-amino acid oxidase-like deaminating enzyme
MKVIVVGGGVFGTWTAYHLLDAGADVTLFDAYGPGHSRSSSGDDTRTSRCGYGPDRIYTDLALRSREQWQSLEARLGGDRIWYSCGVLWMAAGQDVYTIDTQRTLEAGGYPIEVLDGHDLRRRFPEIDATGIDRALFEPGAGVLAARRAVRGLAGELERRGVRITVDRVVPSGTAQRSGVRLSDGSQLEADHVVYACGAWLPRVFPELLAGRIRPTRQVVLYFGPPPGDARFEPTRWPAWIDFPAGIYGTPNVEGRGVKVGVDEHGPPMDPDTDDRLADAASVARARQWLGRRIPAMAGAPVIESRVCQYENTSTGDFLIDRHPELPNVWIAGGGSGHGFKHGPAVGQLVAQMIADGAPPEPRFALRAKTTDARRAVY